MKICWDNLEDFQLSARGNFRKGNRTYYEHVSCLICGDPYLGTKDGRYCNGRCQNKERKFTLKHKKNIGNSRRGKTGKYSPRWKGGVKAKNIPLYDTYTPQLEPYEECRRSLDDPNILEVRCTYCGKWYTPKRTGVESRIQYGINGKDTHRFYCSDECKQECPIYGKSKYYKGQKGHNSREAQPKLRQIVFVRDEWTCQKCGQVGGSLHCHHIDSVVNNPIESADIDNCITLCKKCHKWVHMNILGCIYNKLRKCKK